MITQSSRYYVGRLHTVTGARRPVSQRGSLGRSVRTQLRLLQSSTSANKGQHGRNDAGAISRDHQHLSPPRGQNLDKKDDCILKRKVRANMSGQKVGARCGCGIVDVGGTKRDRRKPKQVSSPPRPRIMLRDFYPTVARTEIQKSAHKSFRMLQRAEARGERKLNKPSWMAKRVQVKLRRSNIRLRHPKR